MNSTPYREILRVDARHPALPGHFPGQPLVPGVVLLDHVAAAVARRFGRAVTGLVQVKFLRPLLPDQDAELVLEAAAAATRLHFRIVRAAATLASGTLEVAA